MQPVMAVLAGGDVSVAGRDVSIAGGEGNVWPVITAQYGQLARNHQSRRTSEYIIIHSVFTGKTGMETDRTDRQTDEVKPIAFRFASDTNE